MSEIKLLVYEQATCCAKNGVTQVELDQFTSLIDKFRERGISIERYNLSTSPMEFVNNKIVRELLYVKGTSQLPITVINNVIVMKSRYLSEEELLEFII